MNRVLHFPLYLKRLLLLSSITVLGLACSKQMPSSEAAPSGRSGATVEAIELVAYQVTEQGPQLQIRADLGVQLDQELVSAALRGVPLSFVYEIRITEPRLYFFEKELAYEAQEWRINYQPLLRQWSVNNGQRANQEMSLQDSLEHISSTNQLTLSLDRALEADKEYIAKLRLHLDTTQLPGAFQFNLFNFRSVWSLSSEWQNLIFQTST
ncbi:MAG: DUF4390 domain-containing protein [Alcaligenaceae bacterium]|nr:DUF4390 domain-containing protein [Alcaligenaceae bacterium]